MSSPHHQRYSNTKQSGVCLPSFKKRMGPSLSCRFLGYAGNQRNLIGWFRRLENTDFSGKIKTQIGIYKAIQTFVILVNKLLLKFQHIFDRLHETIDHKLTMANMLLKNRPFPSYSIHSVTSHNTCAQLSIWCIG